MPHILNHEELAELLPWYVNGTLADTERHCVERHIQSCADCRDNVAMLETVRGAVRNDLPAPLVPRPDPQKLLAALDRSGGGAVRPGVPLIAAAAAVAAVAIMATWYFGSRPAAEPIMFQTATAPGISQEINYVLEVTFTPDAGPATRSAFFAAVGGNELAVPTSDRVYRVALGIGTVSLAELEDYAERIEARPEIAAARFVAVQLPVE